MIPLREQADRLDARLVQRLDTLVPRLMAEAGVDAWVVAGREYNEDPVLKTMLPADWLSARRRTILVFTEGGKNRVAVSRYAVGDAFPAGWDPNSEPDQWRGLAGVLEQAEPDRIAINTSPTTALADGLSASEHQALVAALSGRLAARLEPAEDLAVRWLETRTSEELDDYRAACAVAHGMLAEALSPAVIEPGSTTTHDVMWWLREQVRSAGLASWFQPSVSVQRAGEPPPTSFAAKPPPVIIEPGDLVHIDFGLVWLGLHTDQQQHAYVLRQGEASAPRGLDEALATANRLQDLLMAEMKPGRTGNEVLAATLAAADDAGMDGRVYSHPIGVHGHAAGPSIGLWDAQDGVPGDGDRVVNVDTAWSIELSATSTVDGWGPVSIMLEEDAALTAEGIDWLDGRQTELHLI